MCNVKLNLLLLFLSAAEKYILPAPSILFHKHLSLQNINQVTCNLLCTCLESAFLKGLHVFFWHILIRLTCFYLHILQHTILSFYFRPWLRNMFTYSGYTESIMIPICTQKQWSRMEPLRIWTVSIIFQYS